MVSSQPLWATSFFQYLNDYTSLINAQKIAITNINITSDLEYVQFELLPENVMAIVYSVFPTKESQFINATLKYMPF